MIKLKGKYYGLVPFKEYWFINDKKELKDILDQKGNIFVYQSSINLNATEISKDIQKKEFNTGIIRLDKDLEEIFKHFSQTTRNEIKKIIRIQNGQEVSGFKSENNKIEIDFIENPSAEETEKFIIFYNDFARNKGLPLLRKGIFRKYKNHILISKLKNNGEPLIYHIYLLDKKQKILRLLYSCSLFRKYSDKNISKFIGWCNNYHHYKDIEYGKNNSYEIYDFGGLYLGKSDNDKNLIQMKKIDAFKLKFKPEIITQYHYIKESGIYLLLKKIYMMIFR